MVAAATEGSEWVFSGRNRFSAESACCCENYKSVVFRPVELRSEPASKSVVPLSTPYCLGEPDCREALCLCCSGLD